MIPPSSGPGTPPTQSFDEMVAAHKQSVDRTLLREQLALTPDQRVRRLIACIRMVEELRRAMRDAS